MTQVKRPNQPTASRNWRMQAVRLAHERNLVGKAIRLDTETDYSVYEVPSSSEPVPHMVKYFRATGTIECDCAAGQHTRPCAHAGATLLLITGLAPEYGKAD